MRTIAGKRSVEQKNEVIELPHSSFIVSHSDLINDALIADKAIV